MANKKVIYIDIYHGIFDEKGMDLQRMDHLHKMDIFTSVAPDEIVNRLRTLILGYYNDGLYIRAEEFEDICYLNIVLLFGKEYKFLISYLNSINTSDEKIIESSHKTVNTYFSIDYVEKEDVVELQEKLKELGINTEVYYVETSAFERGAGDYHKKFGIAFLTGAGQKLGKEFVEFLKERFNSYQSPGRGSVDTKKLISYLSEITGINERDLQVKSVKTIEENIVEVVVINRYKEIRVNCTSDLERIDYEIIDKTQTMI